MQKIVVPVKGMHCKSCELLIEGNVEQVKGVEKVEVSHTSKKAKIWYEGARPSMSAICEAVEAAGYQVGEDGNKGWFSKNFRDYYYLANAVVILVLLYIFAQLTGLGDLSAGFNHQSIAMAGVIGLVAGVSSCMALVGGLVLALAARYAEQHPEASRMQKFRPHIFFNLGRVLGFAALGGIIGLIGGALQPSIKTMSILTLIVGAVMVLLGLKLIEIFPVLERVNITIPKFVSRLLGIKSESKEYSNTGAFIGGIMTFFLPCGFTQAMQLYAISTGSFVQGALIMSLFAIGTAPGLLGIGGLSSAFKGSKARIFFATAGVAVIALGIYNISNASRIVFPSSGAVRVAKTDAQGADSDGGSQEAQVITTVYQSGSDITPKEFTVKAGQPVKFIVDVRDNGSGCMSTIMIPGLYNQPQFLAQGTKLTMEFTPTKPGRYPITCAMGIKRGYVTVQ